VTVAVAAGAPAAVADGRTAETPRLLAAGTAPHRAHLRSEGWHSPTARTAQAQHGSAPLMDTTGRHGPALPLDSTGQHRASADQPHSSTPRRPQPDARLRRAARKPTDRTAPHPTHPPPDGRHSSTTAPAPDRRHGRNAALLDRRNGRTLRSRTNGTAQRCTPDERHGQTPPPRGDGLTTHHVRPG
jgi:hypothetical protein